VANGGRAVAGGGVGTTLTTQQAAEWVVTLSRDLEVDDEWLIHIYTANKPFSYEDFEQLAVEALADEKNISLEQMWQEIREVRQNGCNPPEGPGDEDDWE
jgi:hypothetical protein